MAHSAVIVMGSGSAGLTAALYAARANLADAQLNLGYTRVTSPIDGIAGFRNANIGDLVGPSDGKPLATVSQVDPIYAEVPISEQIAYSIFRRQVTDPSAGRPADPAPPRSRRPGRDAEIRARGRAAGARARERARDRRPGGAR